MPLTPFFNAHHAPIGAFATLTFGCKGAKGGLGLELGGPANENLYVGVENIDEPGRYRAFPFFDLDVVDETLDYDVEGVQDFQFAASIDQFEDQEITRDFGASIDCWRARDLTFRVISPVRSVPDPVSAQPEAIRAAFVPAVTAEITVDNRNGRAARKVFFGFSGSDRASNMRTWQEGGLTGVGQGLRTLIATDHPSAYAGIGFQPEAVLNPRAPENSNFMLGNVGVLVCLAPAGEVSTFRFSIAFFREGTATTGLATSYLYTRYFDGIESVAAYSLKHFPETLDLANHTDTELKKELGPNRRVQLSHAIRSYFGSTQCLETADREPLWVVNEGEYRMMNTFDLTVDQLFMELALNPWTVRNVLDMYVSRYSYIDTVKFPTSQEQDADTYPGGLAFTHDMGVACGFSKPGYSCYEQAGLKGVFSYMSYEELVNWALCAALYVGHTDDKTWAERHRSIFVAIIESMMNRDHPDDTQRNGVMGLDSVRCSYGSEITTYDSLDTSLGQARNNVYLAVKAWATYLILEPILVSLGEEVVAAKASLQAHRCGQTIIGSADTEGLLPAVIGEGNEARIIPAIEGLVYPYLAGMADVLGPEGRFFELGQVLARHFDGVMKPGVCIFQDGGWRLSSTSRNSWLSKIYLCQFVSEDVLYRDQDEAADAAHLGWLMRPENVYFAWSDQMVEGKACGSRYYPRGVTAALWLSKKSPKPLQRIGELLSGSRQYQHA